MMKKLLFTLLMLAGTSVVFAQNTYYWVGKSSTSWSSSNWSSTLGGNGGSRTDPSNSDILIFDGSDIGDGLTGPVNIQPTANEVVGKIVIQNNAVVNLARMSSGTTYLYIEGEVSISSGSQLNVTGDLGVMCLVFKSSSLSTINGSFNIIGAAANRIAVQGSNILNFASGSSCTVSSGTTSFSTLTTTTNPSVDRAVNFLNGSTFNWRPINSTGNPFNNSTANIIQFEPESNLRIEGSLVSNFFSNRVLPKLFIGNNQNIISQGNPYMVNSITVESGSKFYIPAGSQFPVVGSVTVQNNATLGAVTTSLTSSNLLMIGTGALQTIGGEGSFETLGILSVATDANVKLEKNITLNGTSTATITGKLDVGDNVISGTANFQFRPAAVGVNTPVTITAGSNSVILDNSKYSGAVNTANVAIGLLVTGEGIPANTYIINTNSSSSTITLSKPATATYASLSGAVVISGSAATIITSNNGGLDASIATTGLNRNFGSGTNFVFNEATLSPFPLTNNNDLGDVTFNASATTNTDINITGTLTLNNAKLTIRDGETVTASSTAFGAGTYSNSAYIATQQSGKLLINGSFSTPKIIPVGTTSNYLPVTLKSEDATGFSVNIFEGVTQNAISGGTAVADKSNVVDLIWNINRLPEDSSPFMAVLDWAQASPSLIGANIAGAEIGVAQYIGSAFTTYASIAYTANTVTAEFIENGPLSVGKIGTTLPVKLLSFSASSGLNSAKLSWKTISEKGLSKYIIQHNINSLDGFKDIYSVAANNGEGTFDYNYVDENVNSGYNYYRLISEDLDGTQYISDVKSVYINGDNLVNVYPNPVSNKVFNISGIISKDIIKVVDVKGRVVIQQIAEGATINSINVSEIHPGIYTVLIENDGKITSSKRVVVL